MEKESVKEFQIVNGNFLSRIVRTSLSLEEATKRLNVEDICGTTNGWVPDYDREGMPGGEAQVQCKDNPTTHKHIRFSC